MDRPSSSSPIRLSRVWVHLEQPSISRLRRQVSLLGLFDSSLRVVMESSTLDTQPESVRVEMSASSWSIPEFLGLLLGLGLSKLLGLLCIVVLGNQCSMSVGSEG